MDTICIADWQFRVNREATRDYTMKCSTDHCLCPYCRNYYETVDETNPRLRGVMEGFGV